MLTKKRLAVSTVLLAAAYFAGMLFLPESIVGNRASDLVSYVFKIGFLSVTAAIVTAFVLILLFKRSFVQWQMFSFGKYKHLLKLMVKRDFQTRYRKSVLGVVWSLLNPLLTMMVMTLVFSFVFRYQIPNYPVYLLSGQIIMGFFSESTNRAMTSVLANQGIIKKVYVPKYIFPVSNVTSSLVNLGFSFVSLLLVLLATGAPVHWTLLLAPVPLAYLFVFSLGVSMLLSSLTVFFRDLVYLYGIFITLLTYLTPIFYPIDIIPEAFRPLMSFNPMYQFVDYFRSLVLNGVVPDVWKNAVCLGFALAALSCGTYVFMSQQDKYILYM